MTLIDVFPAWATGAVFSRLNEKYPEAFPWANTTLDVEYFGNHSGDKSPSALLDKLLARADSEVITSDVLDIVVDIIKTRYSVTWGKLYAVMSAEYNPIENYAMTEEETPNITRIETPNIDRTRKTTQKADVTVTSGSTNAGDVYGFNSVEPVPQAEANATATQRTQGDAENNVTQETETEVGTRRNTETGSRKLTRSGNIGVTTSQQMLESEISLWQWNFFQTVFRDTDTILSCPVYEI